MTKTLDDLDGMTFATYRELVDAFKRIDQPFLLDMVLSGKVNGVKAIKTRRGWLVVVDGE